MTPSPTTEKKSLATTTTSSSSSQTSSTVKKSKGSMIRVPKTDSMDSQQYKNSLEKVVHAIHQIHSRNASQLSYEELYRTAYNLVLQKHGIDLYRAVQDTLAGHFELMNEKLRRNPDSSLLEELGKVWDEHTRQMVMIKDVLMYLDKSWVASQMNLLSVYELGNSLFLKIVVHDADLSQRIVSLILEHILLSRRGELVDLSPIRTIYRMFVELSGRASRAVVEELFEHPVLLATEQYYAQLSFEKLDDSTCWGYLHFAETKLNEEQKLATSVFPDLENKLIRVVQRELIVKHSKTLIEMPNSGLVVMVREDMIEHLQLLYTLFEQSIGNNGLQDSANVFREYISSTGFSIVDAPIEENISLNQFAVNVVTNLITLKEKFEKIVRSSFKGHKFFQKAAKEAFESFINKDVKCAQFLAIYVDELLSGKTSESKGNVDIILDKIVGLFRYLSDKDVFESYYKQHLSKRLLGQKSISQDLERTMIGKLKSECGHQFTSKLEGMFKDMSLSTDASNKYRDLSEKASPIDFSVSVLTSGFWPASVHYQDEGSIHLPVELETLKTGFEKFYLDLHTGRRLSWNYALGSCEVKVTGFSEGNSHEFSVSNLQCLAMLAFNNKKPCALSFREMLNVTGIPREELKRHMISMAVSKYQIFFKTGNKREFLDEDVYTFNPDFKSKLRKVKVQLVSMSSNNNTLGGDDSNPNDIPTDVADARRHLTEAAIVRVMKSRKHMDHNGLVFEVLKHLKFKPTPQELKKRIEALIERE